MNLAPKEQFLKTQECKAFADMAANPALHRALEIALTEMQLAAGKADPAGNWQRLEGAKAFIAILLNLPEPPTPARRGVPKENLQPT